MGIGLELFRPGTEVKIVIVDQDVNHILRGCMVRLTDETLHLAVLEPPTLSLATLPTGTQLTLFAKPGRGLYQAETHVLGYTQQGPRRLIVAFPTHWQQIERRQYKRTPVRICPEQCEVRLTPATGWRQLSVHPMIRNISGGGVLLQHHQLFDIGDPVKLQFRLPNGHGPIRVEGRVVTSRKERYTSQSMYLMGISFTQIGDIDSAAILNYVFERTLRTASPAG